MAYIGKGLVGVLSQSKAVDTMTGDGSDTTLTLSRTPGSVNNVEVYMDGVFQTPGVEYTLSGNTVSFSTAPETGTEIIALIGNDSTIITPNDDSISGTKIAGAVVTDAKIVGMAANKLSGALPAVDGSALTNIPSSVTKSASDPAIDSNPAGGVGTLWANTTSGEMYVLTDATTDANVWTNIGGGDGNVAPWGFPGEISGFIAGGENGPNSNVIDKFSFSNPTTGTDVGDLAIARRTPAGASSTTHGYTCGGEAPQDTQVTSIEKFAFSGGNSTSITTTLTVARAYFDGQSSSTHGYTSGGWTGSGNSNTIDKFPFSNDNGPSTDVGDLTTARYNQAAITGQSYGYNAGGRAPTQNTIDKFSFSSDGNATDHGDLFVARITCSASSSPTHGYASGGSGPANEIQKFAFSSNTTASDIGNLSTGNTTSCGVTGVNHGYCVGGDTGSYVTTIDKFSFSTDGDATDVGDITSSRGNMAGTQV